MKKIIILAAFAAFTYVSKAQTATPQASATEVTPTEKVTVNNETKPTKKETKKNKKNKKSCCSEGQAAAPSCDKKEEKKSCCSKKTETPKVEEKVPATAN